MDQDLQLILVFAAQASPGTRLETRAGYYVLNFPAGELAERFLELINSSGYKFSCNFTLVGTEVLISLV